MIAAGAGFAHGSFHIIITKSNYLKCNLNLKKNSLYRFSSLMLREKSFRIISLFKMNWYSSNAKRSTWLIPTLQITVCNLPYYKLIWQNERIYLFFSISLFFAAELITLFKQEFWLVTSTEDLRTTLWNWGLTVNLKCACDQTQSNELREVLLEQNSHIPAHSQRSCTTDSWDGYWRLQLQIVSFTSFCLLGVGISLSVATFQVKNFSMPCTGV